MLWNFLIIFSLLTGYSNAGSMSSAFSKSEGKEVEQNEPPRDSRASSVFGAIKMGTTAQEKTTTPTDSRSGSVFGSAPKSESAESGSSTGSKASAVFIGSPKSGGRGSVFGRRSDDSGAGAGESNGAEKQSIEISESELKDDFSSTEFKWPVEKGKLTAYYGWRSGTRFHDGIDIGAPSGTKVYAVKDGKVVYSDHKISGYGNMVVIKHERKLFTVYAHHRTNKVSKGDMVKRGEVIAEVGNTGHSRGPHLHFEVRKRKYSVDPLKYFNYIDKSRKKGFIPEFSK